MSRGFGLFLLLDNLVLSLDVDIWTLGTNGVLVLGDNETWRRSIVLIKIFEGTIGYTSVSMQNSACQVVVSLTSLWVEEVDDWNEDRVEDCPDDPELPLQSLNTDWRDLDDDVICNPGTVSTCKFPDYQQILTSW